MWAPETQLTQLNAVLCGIANDRDSQAALASYMEEPPKLNLGTCVCLTQLHVVFC